MRIPVSFSDHDRLFATQIQLVSDSISEERGESACYPDLFAQVMGYGDYDELLSARVEDIHVHNELDVTRASLVEAMTWNAFSQGVFGYHKAAEVVRALDLERLDCDLLTQETRAANAVLGMKNFRPGQTLAGSGPNNPFANPNAPFVIMDEMGFYQYTWLEQTPELIEAGAPAYKSSILANGLAFCWKALENSVEALPDDLDERLAKVLHYDQLPDAKSRRLKFWQEEIISHNFEPAWLFVQRKYKLPEGFEIIRYEERWFLYNKALMGFIPLAFQIDSAAFYKAVAMILCGQPIQFADHELGPVDELGFQEVLIQNATEPCYEHSGLRLEGRRMAELRVKADALFFENWQPYLRSQQWITPGEIPPGVADVCAGMTLMPNRLSPLVLPTWCMEFAESLRKEFAGTVESASQRLIESMRRGDLVTLTATLLTYNCVDLNRYASSRIQFRYPVNRQDGNQEALESALEQYQLVGVSIQKAFPELTGLSVITLGVLHCECEYGFQGNKAADFPNFDPQKTDQLVRFLSFVILFLGASMTTGVYNSELSNQQGMLFSVGVLSEAVAKNKAGMPLSPVEADTLRSMNVHAVYESTHAFMRRMTQHDSFVARVKEWRASDDEMILIRQKGEYLFAEEEVPRERPVSLAEIVSSFRSGQGLTQSFHMNLETGVISTKPEAETQVEGC